jgi:hypothetical protein
MKILAAIAVLALIGAALGFAFPPERDVITTITIAAPPAQVWKVLTDTAAYPAWNPGMVLVGALAVGNVIEHDEGHGPRRMVFHPTIMTVAPDRALAWRGHMGPPRVFDALHYFTLAPQNGGTLFTQGEHLTGVALWLFDTRQMVPGFQAMNAALKARVENQAGAEQPAGPEPRK